MPLPGRVTPTDQRVTHPAAWTGATIVTTALLPGVRVTVASGTARRLLACTWLTRVGTAEPPGPRTVSPGHPRNEQDAAPWLRSTMFQDSWPIPAPGSPAMPAGTVICN